MQLSTSPLQAHVESWKPGSVTCEDPLLPGPVAALSALLDRAEPIADSGAPLPALWHWLYFLDWPAQRDLGPDGHPAHGQFLPPVPDRKRMFAGGRCTVSEPLRLGEAAERISSVESVEVKHGRTGELLFVTQRHEYRQRGRTCLVEEQDIVYRSGRGLTRSAPPALEASSEPKADDAWQLSLRPDPPLLFRFSALTSNAHRIHYDLPYARDEEGYPGLVVHGPLLVLLMMDLVRRNAPARQVRSVAYRLRSPVFAGERLLAAGTPVGGRTELRIASGREARHAGAEVAFA
ncbi:MaoC family dehydratase N-terminal domain-containing protein [Streptomyces sp. DSM 3412]|uniref:MaoC family dehydratase N-terminal domain-containing protein n=1 Tax=Streptomyces gottesmaniae TaxID=3075518 RepID=A0ABU2Z0Z8_9ACTN|nr:MaoC family dehydratase N-terminal domain-containing protein [Streptomyces sp. DSM 3412]MDT0570245.1 MaoC family dehydratase N-terminal domain-containing protein [Streptomyces sp. DSM 3412]